MPNDPLAQLRDIHLPAAVSWWPPAPGWWLLALLLLALVAYGSWKWLKVRRDNTYRRQAIGELNKAWKRFHQDNDVLAYIKLCNIVLRRAALHRDEINRRSIAPLAGQEWFEYLDSCCSKPVFAGNVSTDLFEAQYVANAEENAERELRALHNAAHKWLKTHP